MSENDMTPNELTPSQEELLNNEPTNQESTQEENPATPEAQPVAEQEEPAAPAPEAEPEAPAQPEPAAEAETPAPQEPEPAPETEEPAAETEEPAAEPEPAEVKTPETKQEVIERLRELSHGDKSPEKEEIDLLKKIYYRLRHEEVAAKHEAFINAGGKEEEFQPNPDADEERFKAELSLIKEKRAKEHENAEKIKQSNLKRKLEILEQIKSFSTSPEEANKNYDAFRKLQAEWKETNPVPPENATELWKNYQYLVENFYDMLKLNNEMRIYDFKKNLEAKTHLCEAAEKLQEVNDPVSAFHQLQKLHQEFHEIGPVAKDLREQVWDRFKAASVVINKRHQEYFEKKKSQEKENLEKKTALCEKVEALDFSGLKTFAEWDGMTKQITDIQTEWKTIGFTPKSMNTKIFERFRQACDKFFKQKSDYFKQLKSSLSENYAKKVALCEEAEALKASTDWNATAQKLSNLFEQWRAIGSVPHKYTDSIWKRFNDARNEFYDARRKATSSQRQTEKQNLDTKLDIIRQLTEITSEAKDEAAAKVQELMAKWQATGFVPIKHKEKIYQQYREQVDRLYKELNLGRIGRRLENIKNQASAAISRGGDAMLRERDKLFRQYEAKRNEIKTYENNLGFLNISSKSGNSFVNEIKQRIDNLKTELDGLRKSIEEIDAKATAGTEEESQPKDEPETKD